MNQPTLHIIINNDQNLLWIKITVNSGGYFLITITSRTTRLLYDYHPKASVQMINNNR